VRCEKKKQKTKDKRTVTERHRKALRYTKKNTFKLKNKKIAVNPSNKQH